MNLLLPVILGFFSIFQNVINRQLGTRYGMPWTILVNSTAFLVFSVLLYFATLQWPERFDGTWVAKERTFLNGWFWLAGFMGWAITILLPFTMTKVSTATVFMAFVTSQMLFSLVFDVVFFKLPITPMQAVGSLLALIGVIVFNLK